VKYGTNTSRIPLTPLGAAALLALATCAAAFAAEDAATYNENVQQPMVGVDVVDRRGETIPLDLTFTDSQGRTVTLRDYFVEGRPVILNPGYFKCPGICAPVLQALVATLQQMQWTPGNKFQVITVSFDPTEGPALAAAKKRTHLESLNRPGAGDGWAWLTGEEQNIRALLDAVGFQYQWVESSGQFAHSAALIVLSPDGRITQYLGGYYNEPEAMRLAIVDASNGRLGTFADRIALTVCGYDPALGRYAVMATKVMRIGAVLTILLLAAILIPLWVRDRRRRARNQAQTHADANDAQPHPA